MVCSAKGAGAIAEGGWEEAYLTATGPPFKCIQQILQGLEQNGYVLITWVAEPPKHMGYRFEACPGLPKRK